MAPFGVIGGGFAVASLTGMASASLNPTVALISGLGCIGGIASMSSQQSARASVSIAVGGVGLGILAALGSMNVSPSVYAQLALFSGIGGAVGHQVAARIEPTSLPQAVAGFHCLVGIAAASTAVGDFLVHDMSHMDGFHSAAIYLGGWMGSITFTGSVIACGKLAEVMDTSPLQLAGRDYINMGLGGSTTLALLTFMGTSSPNVAGAALGYGVLSSGLLGLHMTASIGGADMPVVVTLLNSYSGWALCAEGFILDQPVLTIVGALIGSSGAFLTKIMCDGMNRDLSGVIMGGCGTGSGTEVDTDGLEPLVHTEADSAQATRYMMDAQKIMITPECLRKVWQRCPEQSRGFPRVDEVAIPTIVYFEFVQTVVRHQSQFVKCVIAILFHPGNVCLLGDGNHIRIRRRQCHRDLAQSIAGQCRTRSSLR
eukprot:Stramenopile-MAST_4_protein_5500